MVSRVPVPAGASWISRRESAPPSGHSVVRQVWSRPRPGQSPSTFPEMYPPYAVILPPALFGMRAGEPVKAACRLDSASARYTASGGAGRMTR